MLNDLENLTLPELFQELGQSDFTYLEINQYMESLELYREKLIQKIKEKQNEQFNQIMDSAS